jgi:chromosome segregation ATPase
MQAFQPLFHFNLPIPVWQIVLYVGLMSFFLIVHKVRLSLITSYLFILFWLYYSFRGDLVSVAKQDFVVKNVYDLFGFVLVGLGVFAFFFLERGNEVILENLKKRNGEIADLKFKLKKAEKTTRSLEMEVEETQSGLHSQASGLKRVLDAKIDELEVRLEDREALLEKRDGEIAAYKLKAEEAEKRAHALETQVEENQRSVHAEESALKKKLEQELNAKIGELEGRLKDRESLLEKRHEEIEALKLKAEEAEKKSRDWKTQAEETQQNFRTQETTLKKKLGEIEDLKLKGGEAEKKAQALKTHAEETQNRAGALETQIEEIQRSFQTRESALKKNLDARIDEMEHRLKDSESLLEKRAGEIANFKLKAEEAEKKAAVLKTKAEETKKTADALKTEVEASQRSFQAQGSALKKKLEEELNAKIDELEARANDREGLLAKRDGELADFKLRAEQTEKRAHALQAQTEEAQKTAQALMTKIAEAERTFQSQESALKKKLAIELNAKIAELEDRLKDRESLLAKRTAEVGDFKLKAEETEKKAHALKAQVEEAQNRAGALKVPEHKDRQGAKDQDSKEKKFLEQELEDKIFELKDLQAQVNHKDGLLSLMAKRNKELADLKSNADQRIETLEAQLKESQPVLRAEDSGNGHSNPD